MLGFVPKEALCNFRRNYVGIQIRNHSLGTQEEYFQLFCASTIETEKTWSLKRNSVSLIEARRAVQERSTHRSMERLQNNSSHNWHYSRSFLGEQSRNGKIMLDGTVGGCRKIMEKTSAISVSWYALRYLLLAKFTLQIVGVVSHTAWSLYAWTVKAINWQYSICHWKPVVQHTFSSPF